MLSWMFWTYTLNCSLYQRTLGYRKHRLDSVLLLHAGFCSNTKWSVLSPEVMMVPIHSALSLAWGCYSIVKFVLKNYWCQGFINWALISRAFHSDKTSAPFAAQNRISLTHSTHTTKIPAHGKQLQISWKFHSTTKWGKKIQQKSVSFFPSVLV